MVTSSSFRRIGVLALLICFTASTALAAATLRVTGGSVRIAISPEFTSSIGQFNATITPIAPARIEEGTLVVPIVGGTIQKPSGTGEISLAGGMRIQTAESVVEITSLAIVNTGDRRPTLTALVTMNGRFYGRVALFNMQFPERPFGERPNINREIVVSDVNLTLTAQAANALNTAFGTTTFTESTSFGTATIAVTVVKSRTGGVK